MEPKLFATMAIALFGFAKTISAKPAANFYIFHCFGQSNMEGSAKYVPQGLEGASNRFVMMTAVNDTQRGQETGRWYEAVPSPCREDTGLTPTEYSGRTVRVIDTTDNNGHDIYHNNI
jgi:hypothetical protein